MSKKSKKIIAVLMASLMLVMTFAEVPAVFAEDGDGIASEESNEQAEPVNDVPEDVPEVEQEPADETEDAETDPEGPVLEEPVEEEAEGNTDLMLDEGTDSGEPIVIEDKKLYPRFLIKSLNEKYYQNYDGNINVRFEVTWTTKFDGSIASSEPERALEEYNALVEQGWDFKYTIKTSTGTVVKENLTFEQLNSCEMKLAKKTSYYVEVTGSKPDADPVVGTSRSRYVIFTFPSVPKTVKATCNNRNNNVTVKWSAVKISDTEKARGVKEKAYYIYRSTNGKIPKEPLDRVETTKYVDKKMKGGKTYTYFIKTANHFQTGGEYLWVVSSSSKSAKVKVKNVYLTESIRPIRWLARVNSNTTLYSSAGCTNSVGSLSKGNKVYVVAKSPKKIPQGAHPSKFKIELRKKDGTVVKKGWVRYGPIKKVTGEVAYKKKKAYDWSIETKEKFVNRRKYSSKTKYLCWVNTYTQKVNIFKGKKGHWKFYKSYRVTSGTFYHLTALRSNQTIHKRMIKRTRVFVGSTTGRTYYMRYLSFFSKGNSFHSQCWATSNNRQINHVKGNLQPGTKGCMRMHLDQAKWIYNNIPMRTKVVTF